MNTPRTSLSPFMTSGFRGEYHEILPGLYQGSMPSRSQAEFYLPFTFIVVCTDPMYAYLWTYVPEQGNRKVVAAQFAYDPESLTRILGHAQDAASAVRDGGKVLVLCSSGIYRSSLFVALVRMYLGTPLEAALADMVASQPGWSTGSAQLFADSIIKHMGTMK